MHKELHEFFESKDCELKELWHSPVVNFNSDCLNDIRKASQSLNIPGIELFSGAGHDSVYLSQIIPTAMIFVPSKDGLSHNEAEFTADEYLIKGANLLLHATLECLNRTESHAHT
jgi:N-carbamoyl-L-amino-acid hydrolase